MAMLEAFVHDPLINWRLLNTTAPGENANEYPRGRHDDVRGAHLLQRAHAGGGAGTGDKGSSKGVSRPGLPRSPRRMSRRRRRRSRARTFRKRAEGTGLGTGRRE